VLLTSSFYWQKYGSRNQAPFERRATGLPKSTHVVDITLLVLWPRTAFRRFGPLFTCLNVSSYVPRCHNCSFCSSCHRLSAIAHTG
jgi:hypothetical protein